MSKKSGNAKARRLGGFLVKANSEGQPGPQEFGRHHADGANLLADALAPHGGIVMWRAFVYDDNVPDDRAKQAYNEFKPLDGAFRPNVLVQVKNGPIDFQPREPFHPLFGAMPGTPLMMEFQRSIWVSPPTWCTWRPFSRKRSFPIPFPKGQARPWRRSLMAPWKGTL